MEILDAVMKVSRFCHAEFKFPRLLYLILAQEDGYKYCTCNSHPGSTMISKTRLGTRCSASFSISSLYIPLNKYHNISSFPYKKLLWLPLESCVISSNEKCLKDTDHLDKDSGLNKNVESHPGLLIHKDEIISVSTGLEYPC